MVRISDINASCITSERSRATRISVIRASCNTAYCISDRSRVARISDVSVSCSAAYRASDRSREARISDVSVSCSAAYCTSDRSREARISDANVSWPCSSLPSRVFMRPHAVRKAMVTAVAAAMNAAITATGMVIPFTLLSAVSDWDGRAGVRRGWGWGCWGWWCFGATSGFGGGARCGGGGALLRGRIVRCFSLPGVWAYCRIGGGALGCRRAAL